MFEKALRGRNPALLSAAVDLHQAGQVPAGSYVIDLDALATNARLIASEAHRLGLTVVAMTKQFGRNPVAMAVLRESGVDSFVAIDMDCARAISAAGQPLGHVGHLVQVPRAEAAEAASMQPATWTVVDDIKAQQAAEAAHSIGREQPLLARIFGEFDVTTPTHIGGYDAARVHEVAAQLNDLPRARFGGITSYPALTFDHDSRTVRPTPNLRTLSVAAQEFRNTGVEVVVNAPGETSSMGLAMLAEAGVTHVEPGHAFTGTTIGHGFLDLPEVPAMVYVSEVSHIVGSVAMCFGGGLYRCIGNMGGAKAFVGSHASAAASNLLDAELTSADVIDFYGRLRVGPGQRAAAGDTAVFCFRAQAFYTRALVVPVSGIGTGSPQVLGIYGANGFLAPQRNGQ
jgi:predicted amino acid racemase